MALCLCVRFCFPSVLATFHPGSLEPRAAGPKSEGRSLSQFVRWSFIETTGVDGSPALGCNLSWLLFFLATATAASAFYAPGWVNPSRSRSRSLALSSKWGHTILSTSGFSCCQVSSESARLPLLPCLRNYRWPGQVPNLKSNSNSSRKALEERWYLSWKVTYGIEVDQKS